MLRFRQIYQFFLTQKLKLVPAQVGPQTLTFAKNLAQFARKLRNGAQKKIIFYYVIILHYIFDNFFHTRGAIIW